MSRSPPVRGLTEKSEQKLFKSLAGRSMIGYPLPNSGSGRKYASRRPQADLPPGQRRPNLSGIDRSDHQRVEPTPYAGLPIRSIARGGRSRGSAHSTRSSLMTSQRNSQHRSMETQRPHLRGTDGGKALTRAQTSGTRPAGFVPEWSRAAAEPLLHGSSAWQL